MPLLIVNADDFGRNAACNAAIAQCLDKGFCSSATLMANMPGFEEALLITQEHQWQDRIGIHLNLTEGKALSERIANCPRFCGADAVFSARRNRRYWRLSAAETNAVETELRTQIHKCRESGLPLTHADSHNHIHEEPALLPVVIRVLRRERIPFLRIARNIGIQRSPAITLYRYLANARIGRAGLRRTHCFGKADDYGYELERNPHRVDSCEVMIHPTCDANGRLVDGYLGMPIEECVRLWAGKSLTTYRTPLTTARS